MGETMKEFSKWTIDEVEEYFHFARVKQDVHLTEWLNANSPITDDEDRQLRELCANLNEHVLDWNEEELKIKFIGLLLAFVKYDQKEYQAFFERRLTVKIDQQRLAGVVDCVIANGKHTPKRPFFCLHEYKPERHSANDPLAQTLVAMAVAQRLNNDGRPIYGAYIMGRMWYFLALNQTDYAISSAYDATREAELRHIFMALKYIKSVIENALKLGV